MDLERNDIEEVAARAFAAGLAYFDAVKRPTNDLITQAEAKRRFGVTDVMRWKESGLIQPQFRGSGRNHAIWYSLYEITKAQFQEALLKAICKPAKAT